MAPEAEQGKLRNDLCEGLLDGFHSQGSGSGDRSRSSTKPGPNRLLELMLNNNDEPFYDRMCL